MKSEADFENIEGALQNPLSDTQDSRHGRRAIYTVITGSYDVLIEHAYRHPGFDYYCYTDVPELLAYEKLGTWTIRPLIFNGLSASRNQRFHKLMPHLLFPDYEYSLYLDGNIDVLTPYLFVEVDSAISRGVKMAIPKHPDRNCIYVEGEACKVALKDDPETIDIHLNELRRLGYPPGNGLTENNVILRKHGDQDVINIMNEWWEWIVHFSKRDQLSLMFVCWKNSFTVEFLLDAAVRTNTRGDFLYYGHRGPVFEGTVFLFSKSLLSLKTALERMERAQAEAVAGLERVQREAAADLERAQIETAAWIERAASLEREREHLKSSWSYRLGRLLTLPLRRLRSDLKMLVRQ